MAPRPTAYRIPLLVGAFISLVLGVAAGLGRIGWNFPLPSPDLMTVHGPLMVCGLLGTVIALERAVAIGRRWAYCGPLLAASGGITLALGAWSSGAALLTLASLVFCIASVSIFLRQRAMFTLTLSLAAFSWLIGNILWVGGHDFLSVVPWWADFLVLTIAGERLELSRLRPPSSIAKQAFTLIVALFLAGAALVPVYGIQLFSAALLALSAWLLHHDIARHTVKQKGLTRFIAICLLSGYAWLPIAALVGLQNASLLPGASYDAFFHAIFLGFVFAMIFGHAPVIFPAVAKLRIAYHPMFYLPLAVLHGSLVMRLTGDLLQVSAYRRMGGAFNAIALLLFVIVMATSVLRARSSSPQS